MFENNTTEHDRGQVGIGTLIVFIALVLVAAIAAGVLINTAGFLQTQAEATGEESTEQVTNNLQVISEVGYGDETEVNEVALTVSKSPGAGDINLEEVEIQWINEADGSYNVVHGGDVTSADAAVFTTELAAGNDADMLTESGDRTIITIAISGSEEQPNALEPGDSAQVTITTSDGGQAFVELRAPNPLDSPTSL